MAGYTLEQLKAEQARRKAEKEKAATAQAPNEEGLLYKIPGIGGAIKSADQYLADKLGASPQPAIDQMGDLGNIAVDSASLGGVNYAADKLSGSNRFSESTRQARDRQGWAGTAADVAGGFLTPGGVPKTAGRVARVGWNALSGGVQSGIDAYTHGERDFGDIAKSVAAGSGASGALSAIADPISTWWSRRKERAKALDKLPYKTKDDLVRARDAKYDEVGASDTVYKADDLKNLRDDLPNLKSISGTKRGGMGQNVHILVPEVQRDINRLGDMSPKTFNDEIRKNVKESTGLNSKNPAANDTDATTRRGGSQLVSKIDAFTEHAPLFTKDPLGNYVHASPYVKGVLQDANKMHGQVKRFELVDDASQEALRKVRRGRFNPFAPSTESATIQQFSDLAKNIDKGKVRSKFTDPEIAQIKQMEEGTPMRNAGGRAEPYSLSGKFGGPLAQAAMAMQLLPGVGHVLTGLTATGMAGAEALTRMGNRATRRDLEDLKTMILDPAGKGLKGVTADPKVVGALKDRAARVGAAGERTIQREANPTKTFTVHDPGGELDGQEGTVIRESKSGNGYVLKMSDGTTRAIGKRMLKLR